MKMLPALILFLPMMLISWSLSLLTYFLAPLLAMCITTIDGREWLVKPLRWFQSFDHPVDEWYRDKYWRACNWLEWDFTKAIHRYLGRYFWLCRNPAYGFAQFLFGITPTGARTVRGYGKWDSGSNNYELTTFDNCFHFTAQWFFYKNHFLRVNIGWKEHTPFTRWMLATHISPFRTWK